MKQFIKCPECGAVELAPLGKQFKECYHKCSCSHLIFKSKFQPIPALSIRQPWAWLIINGYKDIENRNNLKNFTGDFLIHTGLYKNRYWYNEMVLQSAELSLKVLEIIRNVPNKDFKWGGIIGHATITGYVEKSDSPWFVGKYGLLIKDPKPLPFTPCKGKLSFFYPEIN